MFVCFWVGESDKPIVLEAAEAVWDRRGFAAKEGSNPIREDAKGGSDSEAEEDSQDEVEGATSFEPAQQDLDKNLGIILTRLCFLCISVLVNCLKSSFGEWLPIFGKFHRSN